MKGKRLFSLLLAFTLIGSSLSVFAENTARLERKSFSDDFANYDYTSVDSARYTLYGEGSFASDSGKMQILYDTSNNKPLPSGAGLFVNIADVAGPGEKVRLSFDYGNGNYSSNASARISIYCDEKDGEVLGETESIMGKNQIGASVQNLEISVPDYQSSAYVYIKINGTAPKMLIDNLKIERMEAGVYYPVGGSVEAVEKTIYDSMAKNVLFGDACNTYGDVSTIPERYKLNLSSTIFNASSAEIDVYSGSENTTITEGLGLCISIKDILQDNSLKAKDSFYAAFNYRCKNETTDSSIIAHLIVNGKDCASQVLANDIKAANKQVDVCAKITLPDNFPDNAEEVYLLLEATKVSHAFFKDISISIPQAYALEGGSMTVPTHGSALTDFG